MGGRAVFRRDAEGVRPEQNHRRMRTSAGELARLFLRGLSAELSPLAK